MTVVPRLLLLSIGFSGFKVGIVFIIGGDVEWPADSYDVVFRSGDQELELIG